MKALKIFIVSILLLISNIAFSQTDTNVADYNAFVKSFRQKINYPVELARDCSSSFCLLKVEVDADKKVVDLSLSDAADTLLKIEFNSHKRELNINSLEKYFGKIYGSDTIKTYLIPISFGFRQASCQPQAVKLEVLRNYYKFDRKEFAGQNIMLPAIGSLQHMQR